MSLLRAILIDDEEKLTEVLKLKLKRHCPQIEIIATASNAADGYEAIRSINPDIVFLDIGMPGETGFDMLTRFDEIPFEIIFVTGFDQYAIEAIRYCAIGYVLKPVDSTELLEAVERAEQRINLKSNGPERYQQLISQLQQPDLTHRPLGVPTQEGYEFISTEDIIRCETEQRMTRVFLTDGTYIDSTHSLSTYFKLLESRGFLMSHKSHLINLDKVLKYDREGILIMTDGSTVPLSRRKKSEFMNRIEAIK